MESKMAQVKNNTLYLYIIGFRLWWDVKLTTSLLLLLTITPRGYSGFHMTELFEWGQKSKPKKIPCFKQNPKKSLDQNLPPQKSHAEFRTHKKFQKALNGIKWKIVTLVLNNQKIPYLNQATQKMTCQNFLAQRNPKIKNLKPKKIFWLSLLSYVTWNPELNTCTVTHWPFEGIPFWS